LKSDEIIEVLKKFNNKNISQEEANNRLKNAEPFDFYSAILEIYVKDESRLEKGDLPSISKLFREVHEKNFTKVINELEKDHPISRLMTDHKMFEILLNELEDISKEIKEESKTDRIDGIETVVEGLSHLNGHIEKEERLIFPAWHQRNQWDSMVSYLLEDEHKDILDSYERLLNKSRERKQNWTEKDWKYLSEVIDELRGMIYFHTFHEGDIFYPIIVDQLPQEEFDRIKEKMYDIEKEYNDIPLTRYISYLKNSIYNDKDKKRIV